MQLVLTISFVVPMVSASPSVNDVMAAATAAMPATSPAAVSSRRLFLNGMFLNGKK